MTADSFASVRVVGGLLPSDLLSRLVGGREVSGLAAGDYHLAAGETVREAANRAWSYLAGVWASYQSTLEQLPESDRGTSLTRERWLLLLLRELGFGRVPTSPAGGLAVDGKSFAVSHVWEHVPVHLLGWRIELDRKTPGVAGAADASPQSLVQELLNRSDENLWAVLSNGQVLRLLRDSASLVGSAYVEFDLEAMFDGELFSDFLLLFMLCHESRFEILAADGTPADCWLERWRIESVEAGSRALNQLRDGVVEAIETLGTGFLKHPANRQLREDLADGRLSLEDYRHALLRCVYRLLFLFVAEDRDALLYPTASAEARDRFARYFSTRRLRALARRRRGGPHPDLWRSLALVIAGLGSEGGRPEIGIAGIGGLFEPFGMLDVLGNPSDLLGSQQLSNAALSSAIRALSLLPEGGRGALRVVDYRNLGAEELGSIYESLLDYDFSYDQVQLSVRLGDKSNTERRTTGSYYTPTGLVDCILDYALDPVLDEAVQRADARTALLAVKVCDPACGSGHFLVAAARRIAKRIAAIDSGDPEPPPELVRSAMREVVGQCIYGVDLNPLAAELAKVSLWLEALEPGRPLTFLDAHVKVGNSLLGAAPALLAAGLPDEAFRPVEDDDKRFAAALLKRNRTERDWRDQGELFGESGLHIDNTRLRESLTAIPAQTLSLSDVHEQARRHRAHEQAPLFARAKSVADAWCAAFLWSKTAAAPPPATASTLRDLDAGNAIHPDTAAEISRISARSRFFHWHLEYPDVFAVPASNDPQHELVDPDTGWTGGFSCIVGNPPFLNQLERATAMGAHAQNLLVHLSGGRVRGYTDTSAVFFLRSRLLVSNCGTVGLVQPQSILAARDAQPVRTAVCEGAALTHLWASEVPVFDGVSVITCAPTIRRGAVQGDVARTHGPRFERRPPRSTTEEVLRAGEWSFLLAEALGIPAVQLPSDQGVVGNLARCTADFRDQYYGLAPFVVEDGPQSCDAEKFPPLVTSGLIDPALCMWGETSTRFNKVKWTAPRVDLGRLEVEAPDLHRWALSRLVPKILVGTQGAVIEAVADASGCWIPSVPVISVVPLVPDDTWRITAVLLSPTASAFAASQYAGAGLTMTSIKLSAKQISQIPLPSDQAAWTEGARLVASAHSAVSASERVDRLLEFGAIMCTAYRQEAGDLMSWWTDRAKLLGGTGEAA